MDKFNIGRLDMLCEKRSGSLLRSISIGLPSFFPDDQMRVKDEPMREVPDDIEASKVRA